MSAALKLGFVYATMENPRSPNQYRVIAMHLRRHLLALSSLLLVTGQLPAQDYDLQLRNDRAAIQASQTWIYDDLSDAIRIAREGVVVHVVDHLLQLACCEGDLENLPPVVRRHGGLGQVHRLAGAEGTIDFAAGHILEER